MKEIKQPDIPTALTAAKPQQVNQNFVGNLADEIAKTLASRFPGMMKKDPKKKKKVVTKKKKEAEGAVFLDTSAIIDGRIFDVIDLGLLSGFIIVPEFVLLE